MDGSHQWELDAEVLNVPVPDAPQTIKQNWIPFFTFFLRRIIFCGWNTSQQWDPGATTDVARRDGPLVLLLSWRW